MNAHYVSRLERGIRRYPMADYRAALRAVLGVTTDAEIGLVPHPQVPGWTRMAPSTGDVVAAALAQVPSHEMVARLVVMPGMAAVVVAGDHPILLALVERRGARA
jgi:hypothetical protein